MKLTISSSISFKDKIIEVARQLEEKGHEILTPNLSEKEFDVSNEEEFMEIKRKLMKDHCFKKINVSEGVIVLNYDKNGIKGYVGGNTLLEMFYAFLIVGEEYATS